MILSAAIEHLRPEAQWSATGNDYASLVWIGPGEKPTLAELEAAWAELQSIKVWPSGTMLGINAASAFTGKLIDLQLNGSSKFNVTYDGQVVCGDYSAPSTLRLNPGLGSGGAYLTLDSSVNGRTIRAYDAQFYATNAKQYLIAASWGDSADVGFGRTSAGVARITNGSTGRGTLDAAGYQVGGVAGASAGPLTAITSITVVNGIITAISGT